MSKTTPRDRSHDEAKHVQMMQTPDEWPAWPKLPLTKGALGNGSHELGFLVQGYGPIVYKGNIFTSVDAFVLNRVPKEMFKTFEAVYEAGWRVD